MALCGFRKYPYPIGNPKGALRGGGGGGGGRGAWGGGGGGGGGRGPGESRGDRGWMIKITFQGVNFELSAKIATY